MMFMPACDPNVLPLSNPFTFGLGRGPYTVHKNCYLKKDVLSFNAEYTKQFFDTYKDERKLFSLRIIDTHEFTGELGNMVVDPILKNLMDYLDEKGHLDNTIVHFFSDHGDHINPIGYKTKSGLVERFNPFYFMMIPRHFDGKYGETLKKNTQRLTVAYDIFETNLEYLGIPRQYKYGESLLKKPLPEDRTCKTAYLWDPVANCKCQPKKIL